MAGVRCTCNGCGLLFNGLGAFDQHRAGKHGVREGAKRRRCLSVDELRTAGFVLAEQRWSSPGSPTTPQDGT